MSSASGSNGPPPYSSFTVPHVPETRSQRPISRVNTQMEEYVPPAAPETRTRQSPPVGPVTVQYETRVKAVGRSELAKIPEKAIKSRLKKAFGIGRLSSVTIKALLYSKDGEEGSLWVEVDMKSWAELIPWIYKIVVNT